MKYKTLFWTIVLSIFMFFILVYLGIKFQWVRALQDKKVLENEKIVLKIPKKPVSLTEKPSFKEKNSQEIIP